GRRGRGDPRRRVHRPALHLLRRSGRAAAGAVRSDAMTIAARVTALCLTAAPLLACAAPCGFPALADFGQADQRRLAGRYVNAQYGYAAEIPRGLTAYSAPSPAPDHGFGIALSVTP